MSKYKNAKIYWCQEEPKNMGAWFFVYFHFNTLLKKEGANRGITYYGRLPSASTATGSQKRHEEEQKSLIDNVLLKY